jgi:hypothetical protein
MKIKRPSIFSFFINVVIDLVLICMGALLYYHFMIKPFGPIDLQPAVIQVFGGDRQLTVLVISGLLFIVGFLGLFRSIYKILRGVKRQPAKS